MKILYIVLLIFNNLFAPPEMLGYQKPLIVHQEIFETRKEAEQYVMRYCESAEDYVIYRITWLPEGTSQMELIFGKEESKK